MGTCRMPEGCCSSLVLRIRMAIGRAMLIFLCRRGILLIGGLLAFVVSFWCAANMFRRGDDTIPLFFWMDKLRSQAAAVGGTMLSHLGNHEWMNVIGMHSIHSARATYLHV